MKGLCARLLEDGDQAANRAALSGTAGAANSRPGRGLRGLMRQLALAGEQPSQGADVFSHLLLEMVEGSFQLLQTTQDVDQ